MMAYFLFSSKATHQSEPLG